MLLLSLSMHQLFFFSSADERWQKDALWTVYSAAAVALVWIFRYGASLAFLRLLYVWATAVFALILDIHRIGVCGLLACYAFKSGENATIVVLVALHCKTALCVARRPGESHVVFFDVLSGLSSFGMLLCKSGQTTCRDRIPMSFNAACSK